MDLVQVPGMIFFFLFEVYPLWNDQDYINSRKEAYTQSNKDPPAKVTCCVLILIVVAIEIRFMCDLGPTKAILSTLTV